MNLVELATFAARVLIWIACAAAVISLIEFTAWRRWFTAARAERRSRRNRIPTGELRGLTVDRRPKLLTGRLVRRSIFRRVR